MLHLSFRGVCPRKQEYPDSKIHKANMGPTWGRQDPGGPHVGHINLAIWLADNRVAQLHCILHYKRADPVSESHTLTYSM